MFWKPELEKAVRFLAAGLSLATVMAGPIDTPRGHAGQQSGNSAAQAQAAPPTSFEVASIKPVAAENGVFRISMSTSPGGRYTAMRATASILIQQAYDVKDYQITNGPGWLTSQRYDIVAKADTPNIDREMLKVLLQSLLAERFQLQLHRETKELPIYALVVGKNGHKLRPSENQPAAPKEASPGDPSKPGQAGVGGAVAGRGMAAGAGAVGGGAASGGRGGSQIRIGRGQLNAQMVPVSSIAAMLSQQLGRPVVDRTEIKGNFDFELQWTPDETQRGMGFGGIERPVGDSPLPSGDPAGPSIFTAVQDQLGLRLEATKGPVESLVIDRIEKASGN